MKTTALIATLLLGCALSVSWASGASSQVTHRDSVYVHPSFGTDRHLYRADQRNWQSRLEFHSRDDGKYRQRYQRFRYYPPYGHGYLPYGSGYVPPWYGHSYGYEHPYWPYGF